MQIENRETFKKDLMCGVAEVKVIGFNPTQETINKWRNYTPEGEVKEIEYLKDVDFKWTENGEAQEENVQQLTVDVWIQEVKTKAIDKITFYIIDKNRYNKDGSKMQFCNQYGRTSWVIEPSELPVWFSSVTTTDYYDKSNKQTFQLQTRNCRVGEEGLLSFLAAWTNINNFNANDSLFLDDYKKFFKGNVSELTALLETFGDQSVMVAYEVKVKETDEGTKEYQVINNKTFCAGRFMKQFNNYVKNDFVGLDTDKKAYNLKQFVTNLKNPENTKNFFVLQPLATYDPNANPVNSSQTVISETDSSY